jgi:hypothetical protein
MKRIKGILKSKRGIALENAILFLIITFSLCALVLTFTIIGRYQSQIERALLEQKVALVRSSFHLKYDGDRYFKETLCALREEERIYEIEFFYNLFENSARSNIFKQIMHMNCPR